MSDFLRMPDIRKSMSPNKEFDKNELRERLTPTQYQVTQEHHTERSVVTHTDQHTDICHESLMLNDFLVTWALNVYCLLCRFTKT